jgi:hypothetical protein
MPRGTLNFRQRDLTRALNATTKAGQKVERIKIDKEGNLDIVILNGDNSANLQNSGDANLHDWDKALSNGR